MSEEINVKKIVVEIIKDIFLIDDVDLDIKISDSYDKYDIGEGDWLLVLDGIEEQLGIWITPEELYDITIRNLIDKIFEEFME